MFLVVSCSLLSFVLFSYSLLLFVVVCCLLVCSFSLFVVAVCCCLLFVRRRVYIPAEGSPVTNYSP